MRVYYFVIIIVTLIADAAMRKQRQKQIVTFNGRKVPYKRIYIFMICAIFTFVSAFRYYVGADFDAYYRYDEILRMADRLLVDPFDEPGAALIAWLNQRFLPGVDGVFVIVAAIITMGLFVYTIGKNSDNLVLSFLLFIFIGAFTGSFNGVRQYLATAILFAGYHHVINRDIKKWAITVILASCFHVTAILMFFIYFICARRTTIGLLFLYIAIAGMLLSTYDTIFELLGAMKNETIILTEYTTRSVNRLRVIVQCVPLIIPIITGIKNINQDKEMRFLFNISLFNAAISVAAMNSAYFSRFNIYTSIFQVLMYPSIVSKMNRNNRIILTVIMLIFYFAYWHYETSSSWALNNFRWVFSAWRS